MSLSKRRLDHTTRLLGVAAVLTVAGALVGFSSAATFDMPAMQGGGGGLTYTGSARSAGMDCATCHQGGDDLIDAWVAVPGADLVGSGYEPGVTYLIEVWIDTELRGLDRQGGCQPGAQGCNRNVFVADIVDAAGRPAGVVCPDGVELAGGVCMAESGKETTLAGDGTAVVGKSFLIEELAGGDVSVTGRTRWTFQWQAPDEARADLRLHYAVVDGDGGATLDPAYADYRGDAVFVGEELLWAAPLGGPPILFDGGCSGGGAAPGTGWWTTVLALVAVLLLGATRRRTLLGLAALIVAVVTAAWAGPSDAADTSCDIVTGASCKWNEGCDCDHDGYVRASGQAKKYCHWKTCPLDADDSDPNVLGKVSQYNADGDGYTTKHDCDDNDPCIDDRCIDICPASPSQSPPPAPDPAPTPGSAPSADATSSDAVGSVIDVGPLDFSSSGFAGSGQFERQPPPGCSASRESPGASWWALLVVLVAHVGIVAIRRHRRLVAGALVAATMAASASGCALVKPWERGVLAKDPMVFGSNTGEVALEQHCLQYREGSAGGFGGGGGGCGCN